MHQNHSRAIESKGGISKVSRRLRLVLGGVAATAALAVVVPASGASASNVSCNGDWCSGQNPMTTHCADDAVTVDSYDLDGARLELRWSDTCQANWAKFILYPQGWAFLANNFLGVMAEQDTGYQQYTDMEATSSDYTMSDGGITTTWSPMIYSPVHGVRARLIPSCDSPALFACAMDMALADQPHTNYQ